MIQSKSHIESPIVQTIPAVNAPVQAPVESDAHTQHSLESKTSSLSGWDSMSKLIGNTMSSSMSKIDLLSRTEKKRTSGGIATLITGLGIACLISICVIIHFNSMTKLSIVSDISQSRITSLPICVGCISSQCMLQFNDMSYPCQTTFLSTSPVQYCCVTIDSYSTLLSFSNMSNTTYTLIQKLEYKNSRPVPLFNLECDTGLFQCITYPYINITQDSGIVVLTRNEDYSERNIYSSSLSGSDLDFEKYNPVIIWNVVAYSNYGTSGYEHSITYQLSNVYYITFIYSPETNVTLLIKLFSIMSTFVVISRILYRLYHDRCIRDIVEQPQTSMDDEIETLQSHTTIEMHELNQLNQLQELSTKIIQNAERDEHYYNSDFSSGQDIRMEPQMHRMGSRTKSCSSIKISPRELVTPTSSGSSVDLSLGIKMNTEIQTVVRDAVGV